MPFLAASLRFGWVLPNPIGQMFTKMLFSALLFLPSAAFWLLLGRIIKTLLILFVIDQKVSEI